MGSQILTHIVKLYCHIEIRLQKPALMAEIWRCQKLKILFSGSLK